MIMHIRSWLSQIDDVVKKLQPTDEQLESWALLDGNGNVIQSNVATLLNRFAQAIVIEMLL